MKQSVISLLCAAAFALTAGCSDSSEVDLTYDSTIEPVIEFDDSEEIIAGQTYVSFRNRTTAEGTTVNRYFWHFGFAGEGNWSEDLEPDPVCYKTPGEYTVTLTAWGEDGNKASAVRTVKVYAANVAPTAAFTYTPAAVRTGVEVRFTSTSNDEDGEIAACEWTLPDGSTATGSTALYTFTEAGVFRVTLKVTDDRGESNTLTKAVNVREGDITEFTLNWATAVAESTALCPAGVVAVSDLGYVYFTSSEGKIIGLDMASGAQRWMYDAAAKDNVSAGEYVSYPSVDTDGTVYWVAHGVGSAAASTHAYAFDGETGTPLWNNGTAYSQGDRIYYSTPCITPTAIVVGNRGTLGVIRGFEKATGKNFATVKPANGGADGSVVGLRNGAVVFPVSGDYGFGLMLPDATFGWSAVPTSSAFTPNKILTGGHFQLCVDDRDRIYVGGKIKTGSWNIACFDCSSLSASGDKVPVWSQTLDAGFSATGASLNADASTLYVITDAASPYNLYALNTANGATRWSYALSAKSSSVPAVDDQGRVHLCTEDGYYIVLQDNGASCTEVYKEKVADAIFGSPTLSPVNGSAFFIGSDAAAGKLKVYSVSVPGTSGPADSPWAQYGQNAGHCNYQK